MNSLCSTIFPLPDMQLVTYIGFRGVLGDFDCKKSTIQVATAVFRG